MGNAAKVAKSSGSDIGKRTGQSKLQLKTDARVIKQPPQLLHERAADTLRNMIIEGDILPGSRMPEMELCALLGISRTPLREALKVLAAEGLLVLAPQRGAMVTEPDIEQLDATIEAIAHLEAVAARIACGKASDREIQAIAILQEQMIDAASAGNARRYFRINQDFHASIVKASHNPVLVEMHSRVGAHLKRLRFEKMGKISEELRATFIKEHGRIVTALVARDSQAVSEKILQHMGSVGNMVEAGKE